MSALLIALTVFKLTSLAGYLWVILSLRRLVAPAQQPSSSSATQETCSFAAEPYTTGTVTVREVRL